MSEPITIEALADLIGELRMMARSLLVQERDGHAVRPTALVMSALRRSRRSDQEWEDLTWANRDHFFASMYREMRRALTDYARKRQAMKRPDLHFYEPGDIDLYSLPNVAVHQPEAIIALEEALESLQREKPETYQVLLHHYFAGMKVTEIASLMEVGEKTIKRRLAEGRVMLHRKILNDLNGQGPASAG